MGMKQLMRPFTQRFIEECLIELLNSWVFMGLSELLNMFVIMVKGSGTKYPLLVAGRQGLSPSPYTTSWTAHDLNKVVVGISLNHFVHQVTGIGQAMGHSDSDLAELSHIDVSLLDSL
jgi:hypothetical protein